MVVDLAKMRVVAASARPERKNSRFVFFYPLDPKTGSGSVDHLDASEAEALSRAFPPSGATPPIPLPEGLHELGREQPAELVLPVPTVSARHARLSVGPDAVSVADLGSTNGTYLDGAPLEPMAEVAVGVGQEVVFGDQYLAKFKLEAVEE